MPSAASIVCTIGVSQRFLDHFEAYHSECMPERVVDFPTDPQADCQVLAWSQHSSDGAEATFQALYPLNVNSLQLLSTKAPT